MGKTPSGGMGSQVRVLGKISWRQPWLAYDFLGMSLQSEWQYLQRTVLRVDIMIGSIEEALREKFFPALLRAEEINADFRKNLRKYC